MKTSEFKFVALILVALCVVIFFLQVLFPQLTDMFKLVSADFFVRPWTLITSIFLHGSLPHLLANMLALGLFGSILEKIVGWKKFLVIFFVSGIAAGIGSTFLYAAAVGASGAIFGVIGALAVARPMMVVWAFGVPAPMVVAALVWAIQDVVGLFVPSNVANLAHLVGLGVGILFGIPLYERKKSSPRGERPLSEQVVRQWERQYMR